LIFAAPLAGAAVADAEPAAPIGDNIISSWFGLPS
jgi:hypothetical protein